MTPSHEQRLPAHIRSLGKVHHVAVIVADIDAALGFWRDTLGLPVELVLPIEQDRVTIAFLPVFLANLVFAVRFKDTASSTTAFGANLLGAMLGGALEYLALILGFDALLIVVAVLYGLAMLTGRRHLVARR